MTKVLNANQIDAFAREGAVFPVPVMDTAEIADCYRRLRALEAEHAGRLSPYVNFKPYLLVPWLWELIHDARILDPVQTLVGPDILCWEASFFSKEPGGPERVSWHQDATYWGLSENHGLTAWVAFTESNRENGCMRVVPGTHDRPLRHVNVRDATNMLPIGEEAQAEIDPDTIVDVVLAPGEMSLHHPMLLHGSEANHSAARRVGFSIRYISARVCQRGERGTATLVRGRDHGHFDLERSPESEFAPAARERHRVLFRRFMGIVKAESAMHS
jgi:non-haem Fe2+, alpha-ketoglutarate-dependent halogenase